MISVTTANFNHVAAGSGGSGYTIQQGDTLSQIAARNGVSLQELLAANPQISNPNLIYPGDHLTIPTGGAPSAGGSVGGTQGPSGASGATPGTLQGRIDEAMAYFESQGWSHAQAAGIVGNLQAESGVDPNRGQDGGGPGYGLAQWEGPRQADFQAWAGHDIHQSTFREQLEFIQHELNTTESAASNALKNANTPAEAAEIFCRKYERPGIPHMEARIANANAIASNTSPADSAPGSTPPPANTPAPSAPSAGGNYTVRSGDTMSAIAARNGVSLSDLIAANPQISNPNLIYPGQTINLPGSGNTGAAPSGGSYTVRSGDTMSAIAARNGVSLSDLIAANPQISNPNLIYPGQTLAIPGAGGTAPVQGPSGPSASGNSVVDIAKQFLGRNASDLMNSGELPMTHVPADLCCANFVSAVLQKAGMLDAHSVNVGELAQMLQARGWKIVDAAHAQPGDVCVLNNGHHVELVASNQNGDVTLIGSNNINADGSQQVSYGEPYGNARYLSPP